MIHAMLDSGLPPILLVCSRRAGEGTDVALSASGHMPSESNAGASSLPVAPNHVYTVIGHDVRILPNIPVNMRKTIDLDIVGDGRKLPRQYATATARIGAFIVSDDLVGPQLSLPLTEPTRDEEGAFDVVWSEAVVPPDEGSVRGRVVGFVAPIPRGVHLSPLDAQVTAVTAALEFGLRWASLGDASDAKLGAGQREFGQICNQGRLVVAMFLDRGARLRENVAARLQEASAGVSGEEGELLQFEAAFYNRLRLPKHVWVVELFEDSALSEVVPRTLGHVLIDATSAGASRRDPLLLRVPGRLLDFTASKGWMTEFIVSEARWPSLASRNFATP